MKMAMFFPTLVVSDLAASVVVSAARSQPAPGRTAATKPHTVVLELFTSQGCSSCPPADELLTRLGRERFAGARVIPLAFHVDYWNSLGWSDPFSSPRWSARQNDYARALHSDQVYTPQLVVNGMAQMVGSDERRIRGQIESNPAGGDQGVVRFDRLSVEGTSIRASLRGRIDHVPPGRESSVVVALYENGTATAVGRGENSGRRLANDYIVRALVEAFPLKTTGVEMAGSVTLPLRPEWKRANLGLAAFIQDSRSLAIYAAAAESLSEAR
jgi:hypothetical protein